MPIIGPPRDVYPEFPEDTPIPRNNSWDEHRRVELFLNCKSWKCECGLTNFGRNRNCAKWTCLKPRPSDWRPK